MVTPRPPSRRVSTINPIAAGHPQLFRMASLVLSSLGLNAAQLVAALRGVPLIKPDGQRSIAAGEIVDRLVRAFGGIYRITSPWGTFTREPQPLDRGDLEKCFRLRLVYNGGAIRDAIDDGRYKKRDFTGRGAKQKIEAKVELGARESLERSLAIAMDGMAATLPAGTFAAESLSQALLNLLDTANAASGGKLPISSVPLVTGITSQTLSLIALPVDQVRQIVETIAAGLDLDPRKGKAFVRQLTALRTELTTELGWSPDSIRLHIAALNEEALRLKVAPASALGNQLRALSEFSAEHLDNSANMLSHVDSLVDVLRAAGCTIEILIGDRHYVFSPRPNEQFRALLDAALQDLTPPPPSPRRPVAEIEDPSHRRIIQMVVDGERGIAKKAGCSNEWVRRICLVYGYDRTARKTHDSSFTLGAPAVTFGARREIISWGRHGSQTA